MKRILILPAVAVAFVLLMDADANSCDIRVQPSQGQASSSSQTSASSAGTATVSINTNGQGDCQTIEANGSTGEAHIRMSAPPQDSDQTILIEAEDDQGSRANVKLESRLPAANATGTTTLSTGTYHVLLNGLPVGCIIINASR